MDKTLFFPTLIWFVFTILFLLKKTIPLIIRLGLVIILSIYIFIWWEDLFASLQIILKGEIDSLLIFLKKSLSFAMSSLFWFAPLFLVSAFFTKHIESQRNMLWNLFIFSFAIIIAYFTFSWL